LDYWLIGKARQVGAHIWQKAEVIDLIETPQEYIVHKEEFLLIELGARIKELKNLFNQALETLAKDFGFEPRRRPLWRDACVEPLLYGELFSGSFLPARGNSLLVGDAAGLMLPVSGEEIGMALKSGQMAAISVTEARQSNNQVSNLYLSKLKELLLKLQALYHFTIKAGITPFVTSVIKKQKVYKNPC
jgi:flavin-dependent dehydrogenase